MKCTETLNSLSKVNAVNSMLFHGTKHLEAYKEAMSKYFEMTDYDKALWWYLKGKVLSVSPNQYFDRRYGSYFDENGKQIKELT